MHLSEIAKKLELVLPKVDFKVKIIKGQTGKPYYLENIIQFKKAIDSLDGIPGITSIINQLKESILYRIDADEMAFTKEQYDPLKVLKLDLINAISTIINLYNDTTVVDENLIRIKLPPHKSFEDLQKIIGQLKLAIEIPIVQSKEDKTINIVQAEPGSIWLIVILSSGGLILVGKLAKLALSLRREWINQQSLIKQSKIIGLKADMLDELKKTSEHHVKQLTEKGIKEICKEHFKNEDALQALETSVKLFGELYEKDMQIKYLDETKDIFPTKEDVSLLEEGLKRIGNG